MNYFSTRDKSLKFSFKDIFLRGLAPGGGLFLPAKIKKYNQEELNNLSQLNYNELATEIIFNFCSGEIEKEELSSLGPLGTLPSARINFGVLKICMVSAAGVLASVSDTEI